MQQPYLTSLTAVRTWLKLNEPLVTTDDELLERLIGQVSRAVMSYLQRPNIFEATVSETRDGNGSNAMSLRQWPVLSVSSVVVGQTTVPPASAYGNAGWTLEPWDGSLPGRLQRVTLQGYRFWQAKQNVKFTYVVGHVVSNEPQTVPTGTNPTVTVTQPYGPWGADQGVTYANGTKLTNVAASPSVGQYSYSAWDGNYRFNTGDANAAVLISYSYTPADVEEAVLDTVAERYAYKNRIGVKSQGLSGAETSSFDTSGFTAFAKGLLAPYKRTVPLQ